MTGFKGWRRTARTTIALTMICGAVAMHGAAEARAAGGYVFDPTLSLTGNCVTKSVDQVPDPGCPGGTHPPAGPLSHPVSVATDGFGDIYVLSAGTEYKTQARIDVFGPEGDFLTEKSLPAALGMAVAPDGVLYVTSDPEYKSKLLRLEPSTFQPRSGQIAYESAPTVIATSESANAQLQRPPSAPALDPENGHLFELMDTESGYQTIVEEFGSAAEGNPELATAVPGSAFHGGPPIRHLAVGAHHRLLVTTGADIEAPAVIDVYAKSPLGVYELERVIDGSSTPAGAFGSNEVDGVTVAADPQTGTLFVNDIGSVPAGRRVVYELDEAGGYIATIKPPKGAFEFVIPNVSIAVDNGTQSPDAGNLYVPSSEEVPGHVLAFRPEGVALPPEVEALEADVSGVDEADLRASLQPNGSAGTYTIGYTTQQAFEAEGFAGETVVDRGSFPAAREVLNLSRHLGGLSPKTTYRLRVTVESVGCAEAGCRGEALTSFATYANPSPEGSCPNAAWRLGASADMPDCRAYELVSPANTGGHPVVARGLGAGMNFGTPSSSPLGDSVAYALTGGTIPGAGGIGSLQNSTYVATRGADGWQTESVEPSPSLATNAYGGGLSPDHTLATESVQEGPLQLGVQGSALTSSYLRLPGGGFELLATGSLGASYESKLDFISPDDRHIIFSSAAVKLEPDAPPSGTGALYDRTAAGEAKVVSLLPGDLTPAAGETAAYLGASADGRVVAFTIGGTGSPVYLRVDDAETTTAASGGAIFEGLSGDGRFTFYLLNGDLYRYDLADGASAQLTSGAGATVVNVPRSGDAVYFTSPAVITNSADPVGEFPRAGAPNLYAWRDGEIEFVATVTERDVKGKTERVGGVSIDGLGLWQAALAGGEFTRVPAQSSADGAVLLFSSRADVTGYDSRASGGAAEGEAELYRFDAASSTLTCVSCDPTLGRPSGPATLASLENNDTARDPISPSALVGNLTPDGRRVFFQSPDPLVARDTNALQDVYEWEEDGAGNCADPGGCLSLISTGHGSRPAYLLGVSESGDDVFFLSEEELSEADTDPTVSIYDARHDGGIGTPPSGSPAPCQGEACRAPLGEAPQLAAPGSQASGGSGNVGPAKAGKKAKRKHKHKKHKHKKKRTGKNRHHENEDQGARAGRGGGK